ncbi:MAG TPA: alpha/beta hydrolase-fold protein [Tepidisphaeraceae bacterium]|jgi:enterochelin esterase-like enzyme|nr:alpha/beta hydrolase-fold protein [Tepidisphaeraceae bacterium]
MRTLATITCGLILSYAAQCAVAELIPPAPTTPYSAATTSDGDYTVGPDYTPAPELTPQENIPHGKVHTFTMDSKDSKFYPGISKTTPGVVPYTRHVAVYIPAQYIPGKPAPFIICQDANHQKELPVILDNMIHAHRVPMIIAIFIGNGGGDGKGSERGLEYDAVSGKYAEFVQAEVLPKIERDYHVTFTQDPDARATLGCSSGAACAFTMAWFHPELYHRVLSYSGTYVAQESPDNPASPHGAWEYHEHFIPNSDVKPIRIWMEVGENDNRATDPESTYHNWLMANFRMAAAFKAKGYHYQFIYAQGAKHCDGRVKSQTLPEALEWLWKDYPSK